MKTHRRIILFITMTSLNLLAGDAAGHGGGTSGDLDTPFGTVRSIEPWFEGQARVIKYCYVVSKDFGVDHTTLISSIENAFNTWREYLEKKKLDHNLATTVKHIGTCDGSEDLKVYFGIKDAVVKAATPQYCTDLAFAYPFTHQQKTRYDKGQNWAKGIIWIADKDTLAKKMPFFEDPEISFPHWDASDLGAILLHEVGHVFGNAHAERTIMDPTIGRWIWSYQDPRKSYLPESIKKDQELFRSVDWEWEYASCNQLMKRVYAGPVYDPFIVGFEDSESKKIFEMFTGRKLKGSPRIRMIRGVHSPEVFLEDDSGSYPLKLGIGGQAPLRTWYAFGGFRQLSSEGLHPLIDGEKLKDLKTGAFPVFLKIEENIHYAQELRVIYTDGHSITLARLKGNSARCERY